MKLRTFEATENWRNQKNSEKNEACLNKNKKLKTQLMKKTYEISIKSFFAAILADFLTPALCSL